MGVAGSSPASRSHFVEITPCLRKTPCGKPDWTTTSRTHCCMYYPHTEELLCTTSHKRNLNNTNPSSRRCAYTRFPHLTLRSIFSLYTLYHTDRTDHVCERWISHLLNASVAWHRTSVLRQYVALQHTTHDCSDNSRRQTSRLQRLFRARKYEYVVYNESNTGW